MDLILEKTIDATDADTDDFALDIRVTTMSTTQPTDGRTSIYTCYTCSCSCVTCADASCWTCYCPSTQCTGFLSLCC